MADTFLFHDYETSGTDPARDGVFQFAAIRTDTELAVVDDPVNLLCLVVIDRLPHPEACLITGITPQMTLVDGLVEAEFADRIQEVMAQPGTCSLGYNSIRFDDAFTRHLLWRNFHDPYAREWKNGNSRFDLIDLTRLCYALRPQGLQWPMREDGKPSFRLEHIAATNDFQQQRAHDALSDVHASIDLARAIRGSHPRLWQWALGLRNKRQVQGLLDWNGGTMLLHSSEKFPAERGCTSLVLPVCPDPNSDQGVLVIDLMADPALLLDHDADELRDRLFTPRADLPEDIERPAIKSVFANRCPMLAPVGVLEGVDVDRIQLDPARCERNRRTLLDHGGELRRKLTETMQHPAQRGAAEDPELSLYSGGFASNAERARLDKARRTPAAQRGDIDFGFEQDRHRELLFRQRARNWPESLDAGDRERWQAFVAARLQGTHPLSQERDGPFGLEQFHASIDRLRSERPPGPDHALLDQLSVWGQQLRRDWLAA